MRARRETMSNDGRMQPKVAITAPATPAIRRPSSFINLTVSYYLMIVISQRSSHSSFQFAISTSLVAAVGMNSRMRCGIAIRILSLALNIYVYSKQSKIFNTRKCSHVLLAYDIQETVSYGTCLKSGQRPCKY